MMKQDATLARPQPRVTNWDAFGGEWEAVDDLIGRIYECALDPTQWDDTLARVVSTFSPADWDVAMLMWESLTPPAARFVGTVGLHPAVRDVYLAVYAGRNLWSEVVLRQRVGRVVDTADYIPPEAFRQTPLYEQFFKTWKMDRAVVALLDRRGSEKLGLLLPGVSREPVEDLKRGLRLIAPHLQRSARIRRCLGDANLRADAAEAALDRTPSAIATLGEDFQILHLNKHAARLVNGGLFREVQGRFQFMDPKAQRALSALRAQSEACSSAFSAERQGESAINILAARVAPGSSRDAVGRSTYIVCMGIGDDTPLIEIDRLRAWFGLTPTEGRLAAALGSGVSLQEYAEVRNVSIAAARFLLKSIFRKAEVSSQAQLVARLRALPVEA